MKQVKLDVTGMQCSGCETAIEEAVSQIEGVDNITADYPTGKVSINFDDNKASLEVIQKAIEKAGYPIATVKPKGKPTWLKFILALLAVIAVVVIMVGARKLSHYFSLPDLSSQLSDSMIFIIGLITGLHCIGMCGSFVISYTARDAEQQHPSWLSHLLYGLGKTFSYAMFGALFGFLGSLISITPFIQGVTNLVAGGFLFLFGLNMLNVFAVLKHIRIKQPKSVAHLPLNKESEFEVLYLLVFFQGFYLDAVHYKPCM